MHIYLFEPSSPTTPHQIQQAINLLKKELVELNISSQPEVRSVSHPGSKHPILPYLACCDEEKAKTFSAIISQRKCQVLLFSRGGYGSSRWISMVNWEKIRTGLDQLALVGFSDTTFIALAVLKAGGKFIHGPMATTLSRTDPNSRRALYQCIARGKFPVLQGITLKGLGKKATEVVEGELVGGNLTCICHSIGSKFEPNWDGKILFLEDCNEEIYRLDRKFTHLIHSGVLDKIKGLVLGQFILKEGEGEDLLLQLIADRFAQLDIPVIYNIPAGHGHQNMPLLLGGRYRILPQRGIISLEDTVLTTP